MSAVTSSHLFHGRWDNNGEFCAMTLSDSYKNETKNKVKTVLHELLNYSIIFIRSKFIRVLELEKRGTTIFSQ